jgi:hypothetical protein
MKAYIDFIAVVDSHFLQVGIALDTNKPRNFGDDLLELSEPLSRLTIIGPEACFLKAKQIFRVFIQHDPKAHSVEVAHNTEVTTLIDEFQKLVQKELGTEPKRRW